MVFVAAEFIEFALSHKWDVFSIKGLVLMKCKCCLNYVLCILKDLVCIYAAFAKETVFNSSNKRHQMLSHSLPNPFEFHCVAVQKGELLDKQLWHRGYHTQLSRHSWETHLLSWEGRGAEGEAVSHVEWLLLTLRANTIDTVCQL